jgi:hypothetical protein
MEKLIVRTFDKNGRKLLHCVINADQSDDYLELVIQLWGDEDPYTVALDVYWSEELGWVTIPGWKS